MNRIKQIAALCILAFPVAALAAGSASGTVSHQFVSASFGDIVFVEVSGVKTGNPACSTNSPWQFVIPRTSAFYQDLFTLLQNAQNKGGTVTVTGTGTCSVASNTETIASVEF